MILLNNRFISGFYCSSVYLKLDNEGDFHNQGEDLNSSEEDCQLARRRIKVRPRGMEASDESGPSSLQSSLSGR